VEVEHSGEAIVTQNGVQRSEEPPSTLNNLSVSFNKEIHQSYPPSE